jgi:Domain of unknown function (DUF4202)
MNINFEKAIQSFDQYNSSDPNKEIVDGKAIAKELLYAQRMSDRLDKYYNGADEHIKLAVRCQHIGRWEIGRKTYPDGKKGYFAWRNKLKDHHAEIAARILAESGYEGGMILKVQDLLEKRDLRSNPDTQLLEDVVCLVFVEYYLDEFAGKHDDEKVIDILRKTLKKMTPAGIEAMTVLLTKINLSSRTRLLIDKATSG